MLKSEMVNNKKVITSDWLGNYLREKERHVMFHLHSLNVLTHLLGLSDQTKWSWGGQYWEIEKKSCPIYLFCFTLHF